jgi:hypothetical protein
MKVLYLREREGRHSRQPINVRSAAQLKTADRIMGRLGFTRLGSQYALPLEERGCKRCGQLFDKGVHLPDESWCRRCIRITFGGERE